MREPRCWVHKTANVLAKLPKSQQPKAKRALLETWMAETKVAAELPFDAFIESYALKYGEGGRLPEQGSRHAARFLRLPGRALETLADDQPHRKHLRHCAPPHHPIEGLSVERDRACDGLQTGRGRTEKLAASRRSQPVAKTRSRCDIRRRLTGPAVTKIWR
jgi:hypothetical protein